MRSLAEPGNEASSGSSFRGTSEQVDKLSVASGIEEAEPLDMRSLAEPGNEASGSSDGHRAASRYSS